MYQNNIFYFKKIDSTMNIASKLAEQGCSDCTTVVAEQQDSGFGRMGRLWYSDLGGLYFSIIIHPNISINLIAYIGFAAAIDIVNTIKYLFGINAVLKWPNDILFNNHKICGILSRVKISNNKISYAIVGIGLNVNNNTDLFEPKAISISNILGHKVQNHKILSTFLKYFTLRLPYFKNEDVIKKWKEMNVTLGRVVKIITLKDEIEGLADDIDIIGNLKVITKDGSIKTVIYGDCFHY